MKSKMASIVLCLVMIATVFSVSMPISAYPADWGEDTRLTHAPEASIWPQVVIDSSDILYVVWQDYRDGSYNIYIKNSSDFGKTWSSDIKVTDTTLQSGWPQIAIDSNDMLHLLWLEEDETSTTVNWQPYDNDYKKVLYKNSGDGGITWSSEVQIAGNTGQMQRIGLDIAVGKDDVLHVSYSKYPPSRIYHRKSTDSGSTWSTPKVIGNDRDAARPTVIETDSNGHVYVAFQAWGNVGDIKFVKSDDNGDTWDSEITLIGGYGWANFAYLTATDDGHVFLTYTDNLDVGTDHWTDPPEIYIRISDDYGQGWGSRIRLTYDDYRVQEPTTVTDSNNNAHIVWYDERHGNWEIYYTKIDSSGNTLIDDTRITDDPATSMHPVIAIDSSGNRHVFWSDNRITGENFELFYKLDAQPPVADAGPDQTVNEGDVVQFDGSASHDPDGTIETYQWDFDEDDGLWWETGATSDAVGVTAEHTYGDDGGYNVTLRVTDDQGLSGTDICNITVLNVNPTVAIESTIMDVEIGLRVAGRKYNDIGMTLFEDGVAIGYVSIERLPGSPDDQMAWIPITFDMTKTYSATVTFTPEDPPNIGGNPVWIHIKFENGEEEKIHHTFNVQQSKKRDSEHWNHIEPWEVDLNVPLIGHEFEITSHVTDPGSDDETLTYSYGSQIVTVKYLNNPPNPDLYPSPEDNPMDILEVTTLTYEGAGTVELVVKDDDNIRLGVGQGTGSFGVV